MPWDIFEMLYNFSYIQLHLTIYLICLPNWLYAQLHYFLNLSQLLVSCLLLLAKLD